ncbi:MAG: hypothetical protein ABR512_08970 [Desulfopila sp.]
MFQPRCLPILIGSLPLTDHQEAVDLIRAEAPQIPLWPQLPALHQEGMVRQFISGFPGLREEGSRYWVDSESDDFETQMTSFYTEYMAIVEDQNFPAHSRFCLGDDTTRGFSIFLQALENAPRYHTTLKGQITGPVTTGIGVKDRQGKSIIYDDNLRDMLVKMLALKAQYQVRELEKYSGAAQPIVFIDEPGIVSFGSSAFVGITKEMVIDSVSEVIEAIQSAGGLAGVHICANGDWSPVLASNTDIISFDAYFYFDNFVLYKDQLKAYLRRGGVLAWGIVPTSDPGVLYSTTGDELFALWVKQLGHLQEFGFTAQQLMEQTLIAPSCGTGSLPTELAIKVMQLTAEVSSKARAFVNTV